MPNPQTAPSAAAITTTVAAIWRDVLRVPDGTPPEATFFELGGQSISAVRITARIEEELGVEVDMGDLFEDPDLATFTRDIAVRAGAA
ncbi:MAG: phosphopantetheine-binding protein [Catenulispora sp. 13_1_20CM_3_70_7]|jgi:peptidyl carrier protein|nr:MAG: phosphopantetheine-binding protein [Catenulispora sp. 13_1_20CM_3_70_7]